MIWVFLIQAFIAISAFFLLRIHPVRDYLITTGALALRISMQTADILFKFILVCIAAMAIVSLTFFLGLGIRAIGWTGFGNGLITSIFILVAIVLGVAALCLGFIAKTATNAIMHTREAASQAKKAIDNAPDASKSFEQSIEDLKTRFPEHADKLERFRQFSGNWFSALFNAKILGEIVTLPFTIALDTAESIANAVHKLAAGVLGAVLWLFISGLVTMWMPESANAFWLIAIPYGLLVLLGIGAYKGKEWCEKHHLPDLWWTGFRIVRLGVRVGILAVAVGAIWASTKPNLPHWLAGARTAFLINEEEMTKDHFGRRFDQRIFSVVDPGYAYSDTLYNHKMFLPLGALLWKSETDTIWTVDGVRYARYRLNDKDGLVEPSLASSALVYFPESKLRHIHAIEVKMVLIPKNTNMFRDSTVTSAGLQFSVPSNTIDHTTQDVRVQLTNRIAYAQGVPYRLLLYPDRNRTYKIWVKDSDIQI